MTVVYTPRFIFVSKTLKIYIMRRKILYAAFGLGWVFLGIFLVSGYYFNKMTNYFSLEFTPINLDDHFEVFNGLIQCRLIEDELLERKITLRETIFSQVLKKEESTNEIRYFFEDDSKLLSSVLEHVQIEKACCPFFKFDISILPFNYGFVLQISGSEDAIQFVKEIELED